MRKAFLQAFLAALPLLALAVATPSLALDLNSYRAQHGLKPLRASASLAAYAHAHAYAMAARGSLDHDGFVSHAMNSPGAVFAENVLWGCASMDCAIRKWAESPGHRANMLRGDLDHYGIASAASGGRRFWVMELSGDGPRVPRMAHVPRGMKREALRIKPDTTPIP